MASLENSIKLLIKLLRKKQIICIKFNIKNLIESPQNTDKKLNFKFYIRIRINTKIKDSSLEENKLELCK